MGRQKRKLWKPQKNKSAETDEKILHALAQGPMTDKDLREATGLDASTLSDHRQRLMNEVTMEDGEMIDPLIGKHYNEATDSLEYFTNATPSLKYLEDYAARLLEHHHQLMKGTIEPLRALVHSSRQKKS